MLKPPGYTLHVVEFDSAGRKNIRYAYASQQDAEDLITTLMTLTSIKRLCHYRILVPGDKGIYDILRYWRNR